MRRTTACGRSANGRDGGVVPPPLAVARVEAVDVGAPAYFPVACALLLAKDHLRRSRRSTTKEKHMGSFMNKSAKAILAAVIAALGSLATVMVGDIGFADLSAGQ